MAHTYVKVKHREKVLKLRPSTVSVTNLAMIFKLEAQQGIYTVHSEEEAEIILPSESGTFLVSFFENVRREWRPGSVSDSTSKLFTIPFHVSWNTDFLPTT